MDSVYGTKKYFPSFTNGTNPYRGQSCRSLANEYSYSNSMGRHSPVGPYLHMNKQATYSTDLSANSHYGYNTWGTMTDVRNIAPRLYTSKRPQKFRSYSIILTTAALIILLAVLSIGGLAYYFSGFKPITEEPIMVFEGSFRIQKGDSYSKSLKNNQTSIYRQKVDFYRRFVERSLSDNGLQLTKVDIRGFGDGPLIDVQFVTLLDMQNVPQNIHSIEDHIRNSLFLETNSLKSLYKFLKIEPESVRIVRVTGDNMSRMAPTLQHQEQVSKQHHFEKKLTKNLPKGIERKPSGYTPTTYEPKSTNRDSEPDIDVANAPVIKGSFEGSFEITKTDADITAKKTSPAKVYTPYSKYSTTSIRLKNKKNNPQEETTTPISRTPTVSSNTVSTEAPEITTMIPPSTTIIPVTTTTSVKPETSSTSDFVASTLPPTFSTQTTEQTIIASEGPLSSDTSFPPRLDLNLFTSAPVLDTKPWLPIRASGSVYNNFDGYIGNERPSYTPMDLSTIDRMDYELIPRNKLIPADLTTEPPSKPILYQSFTNPEFILSPTEIEKLGSSDVKPYPIPVPLIDEVVAPDLTSVLPMHKISSEITSPPNATEDSVETVSEEVTTKRYTTESPRPMQSNDTKEKESSNSAQNGFNSSKPNDNESSAEVGEILLELLQTTRNITKLPETEQPVKTNQTDKPNFLNIKDIVLNKTKFSNKSNVETKLNNKSPGIWNDTNLFPTQTKWEYKQDLTNQAQMRNSLKKKYNDTLQAVIVENHEHLNASRVQSTSKRNSSEDIENITLIFDTLASKLGITSSFPTKEPPFALSSNQKKKQDLQLKDEIKQTSLPPVQNVSSTLQYLSTTPMFSTEQEPILGEAEVEVVDPTKYEEMLSSQSVKSTTNHPPALVTLMPVRSNSGIRQLNPFETAIAEGRKFGSEPFVYREAIVRSDIQVQA